MQLQIFKSQTKSKYCEGKEFQQSWENCPQIAEESDSSVTSCWNIN